MILALLVAISATLVIGWRMWPSTSPTPQTHPLDCLDIGDTQATPDATGWWTSFNITITYACFQTMRQNDCTNCTIWFVFTFANGSKSQPFSHTIQMDDHPGPGYEMTFTPRFHFTAPEPPNRLDLVDRRCNG